MGIPEGERGIDMPSAAGAAKARQIYKEKEGEDAHRIAGRRGGSVKSDAKKEAARLREQRKREARENTKHI